MTDRILVSGLYTLSIKTSKANEQVFTTELLNVEVESNLTPGEVASSLVKALWVKNEECAKVLSHKSSPIFADPAFVVVKEIEVLDTNFNKLPEVSQKIHRVFNEIVADAKMLRSLKPKQVAK